VEYIPETTDLTGLLERNEIAGKYRPQIAAARGDERRKLFCEFATAIADQVAQSRIPLAKDLQDVPRLRTNLLFVLEYFVMPFLDEDTIDEEARRAMWLVIRSRADYWVTQVVARFTKESRDSAIPKGLDTEPEPTPSTRVVARNEEADRRRALVDAFIEQELNRTGKRITKTTIWKRVGYRNRTEFERWMRNDPKATKTAADRFTRLLREKSPLK
jgi:hypothetical protein